MGDAVFAKTNVIKDLGNLAVHSARPMLRTDAVTAVRELLAVRAAGLFWPDLASLYWCRFGSSSAPY